MTLSLPHLQAFGSNGYVDFYLSGKRWVIELLRDSNNVKEHLARFDPGGLYHPMLENGSILAYAVVNLRGPEAASSTERNSGGDEHLGFANLLTFTFDNDYRTAVFTREGKPDEGELLLIGGGQIF